MRLVSVSVGLPKTVQWRDQPVTTGIFKSPVEGRVALRKHNLDGDQQADLSVHGGPTKAVYVYPIQHYTYWRGELPDVDLGWDISAKTSASTASTRSRFASATSSASGRPR